MSDGPVMMVVEASTLAELAAITSFASLAADFVISNPEILARFQAWMDSEHGLDPISESESMWTDEALRHLAGHLNQIALHALHANHHHH